MSIISLTPALDSYPQHKPIVVAFADNLEISPTNKILFQAFIVELVDIIGDDDLYFELQDIYDRPDNLLKR